MFNVHLSFVQMHIFFAIGWLYHVGAQFHSHIIIPCISSSIREFRCETFNISRWPHKTEQKMGGIEHAQNAITIQIIENRLYTIHKP